MEKNTKRNLLTVGAIASIVALGGVATTASAAGQVDSGDIKNQSIRSIDIAAGGVGGSEIRNQSIHSVDIATNGVGKSEIRKDAVGTSEIDDQSIQSVDIDEGAVGRSEIRNGTITLADIADSTEDALRGQDGKDGKDGKQGPAGPAGPKGEKGEKGERGEQGPATPINAYEKTFQGNVKHVGGGFSDRATEVGKVTIPAGTYVFTTDALFRANAQTSGTTDLQVAVRYDDGTEWGGDLGTGFTGMSPIQKDREVTTSTTRIETLTEDTEVTVYVFGYDSDGQSSEDSGLFDAVVNLSAVPVTAVKTLD